MKTIKMKTKKRLIDNKKLEKITKEKEEILNKLNILKDSFLSFCHKKGCTEIDHCPESCACQKKLNTFTSIAWTIALQMEHVTRTSYLKTAEQKIQKINIFNVIKLFFTLNVSYDFLTRNSIPINKQTMELIELIECSLHFISKLLIKDVDYYHNYFNIKFNMYILEDFIDEDLISKDLQKLFEKKRLLNEGGN